VSATLAAAEMFRRHGCSVIPVRPHDKRPAVPWAEFQRRRATDAELIGWWGGSSRLGLAVVCGRVSALAVVDVDPRHGGRESLAAYSVPICPTVRTGGGGEHYYLATAATMPKVPALLPGVDLQAEGSYVVAPPSLHPNGTRYEWLLTRGLGEVPLPAVPFWLRRLIQLHRGRPPVAAGPLGDGAPQLIAEVLASLDGARRAGTGWLAKCPAHHDVNPSLSIGVGRTRGILLHCHAGCPYPAIRAAIGQRVAP
jgi:Bifunctional DNA primase/polymerase, N-terminal